MKDEIYSLIKSLAGQNNILTIPRLFIDLTGDMVSALLLSQLIYWTDRSATGWVYKSYKDWREELGLSEDVIRRAANRLIDLGLIEKDLRKANGAPTLHYKVVNDFAEKVIRFLYLANPSMNTGESPDSLTEITTKEIITSVSDEPSYEPCDDDGLDKPEKRIPKPKRRGNPDVHDMAEALSEVTGMPLDLNRGRLYGEAKILLSDGRVSPVLIRSHYGQGGAWYMLDWRGKQGQRPKPSEIRETLFSLAPPEKDNIIKGDVYTR